MVISPSQKTSTLQRKNLSLKHSGYSPMAYPPLNTPLLERQFGPESQPADIKRYLYTEERLCLSAKYSPDALPVKEIAFSAHA